MSTVAIPAESADASAIPLVQKRLVQWHLAAFVFQTFLPKRIKAQLLPQSASSPAIAKAARLAHAQRGEPNLNDIVGRRSPTLAIREEPTLQASAMVVAINDLQRASQLSICVVVSSPR